MFLQNSMNHSYALNSWYDKYYFNNINTQNLFLIIKYKKLFKIFIMFTLLVRLKSQKREFSHK